MPDANAHADALIAPGDEQTRMESMSGAPGHAQQNSAQTATEISFEKIENEYARPNTNGDARVRAPKRPPPENWIVIDQAMPRFAKAGLPIKLRTVQKYCLNGKLRSTLAVTDKNTFKYFIDPTSIDEFITREAQKTPTGNEPEPVVAMHTPGASDAPVRSSVRDDYAVYEHPYVKRLEREVDEFKQKYDSLQAAARADLIKLHETYAVAQSETLAKYLLIDKGKAPGAPGTGEAPATSP